MTYKNSLLALYLAGCVMCLSACGGAVMLVGIATHHTVEVSGKEKLWGGYEPGAIYDLQIDFFLQEVREVPIGRVLALCPPSTYPVRASYWGAPSSEDDYEENTGDWPEVVGMVRRGAHIECTKLKKNGDVVWGYVVDAYGRILDGPHQDKIVYLSELSNPLIASDTLLLTAPDPRFLKRIDSEIPEP